VLVFLCRNTALAGLLADAPGATSAAAVPAATAPSPAAAAAPSGADRAALVAKLPPGIRRRVVTAPETDADAPQVTAVRKPGKKPKEKVRSEP